MIEIFHIASEREIKNGKICDVYFERGDQVLTALGLNKTVVGEVRAARLPDDTYEWAVLAGLEEVTRLFVGSADVTLEALPEGTLFGAGMPVLTLAGRYIDFARFETALLGFLCQASGIATKAARCKIAAGDRKVYSFGARRMHPAISPMIERSAFIGGCDGVAVGKSAELIGEKPVGTMAHALIITIGDEIEAFQAFDRVIEPGVKRIALIDTFNDEKFAAVRAAEALGDRLYAIRIDTPASRRGDFSSILKEVRWELDLRGFKNIKIFVSGGIDEYSIAKINPQVDAYGVGTAISNAPVIDFSFDLVEVEGKPIAKRGKESGLKSVWRCEQCFTTKVTPRKEKADKCICGGKMQSLLTTFISNGSLSASMPDPQAIRKYVLKQLAQISHNL